ncbi:UDP-N-acetylglucosamine--N-acetylmuramyl-(pentapeptide) pyrophosphoryl-undecaprenol N-acetylglucosamine transferase [Patescibacteria group bacterium]|nr:UDP-N-acetylglucosamine--N-acetylmuramyl-(pentapeptide) pyrophosphoryl-undecaprenol N-acetylglucosamine transferase [Patescibacteria group bacterium]
MEKRLKILMTGGGTLGPVTPLLAVAKEWQKKDSKASILWIGTPGGPEQALVGQAGYPFYELVSAKLDRHAFWKLPFMAFVFAHSLVRAYFLLRNLKPNLIFSAGGYVSVPVVVVGKFMGIPSWVHQLDVKPGLANKIMAPFASRISTTWKKSAIAFPKKKTIVVGGIERQGIRTGDGNAFLQKYGLDCKNPTVLVMGGGTGAKAINDALIAVMPDLAGEMNIIHLTGEGKNEKVDHQNYLAKELLTSEMGDAYAAADIVIARAGMGTILEVIALCKPTILIPISGSHQELNAKALEDLQAAVVIKELTPQVLKQEIERLVKSGPLRRSLEKNIKLVLPLGAEKEIVKYSEELIK